MTDIIDRASAIEQQHRDNAIKASVVHEKPLIINGVRRCLECEVSILQARINAVNAVRCISCQGLFEHQQKHYINGGRQF